MCFANRFLLIVFCTLTFIKLNAIKESLGSVHLDAIVEYFKDKDNLSMVIGAGDTEHDYIDTEDDKTEPKARFKNYTFLVNYSPTDAMQKRMLKSETIEAAIKELEQRLSDGQKEPIPLLLNFNERDFFMFLKNFPEKFNLIIFDCSVSKFINANPWNNYGWNGKTGLPIIFKALEYGGEFYIDSINPGGNDLARFINDKVLDQLNRTIPDIKVINNIMSYDPSNLTNYIIQKTYTIMNVPENIHAGDNVTKKEGTNHFIAPSNECRRNHAIKLLNDIGFKTEYKENSPYPLNNPWIKHVGINFEEYNYIYAQKPIPLEKKLVQLKNSISQLKSKLQTLNAKLMTLKEALDH